MATFTNEEFRKKVAHDVVEGTADEQTDNSGQIVIYTNFFEWRDGTIHDDEDPNWDDEEEEDTGSDTDPPPRAA